MRNDSEQHQDTAPRWIDRFDRFDLSTFGIMAAAAALGVAWAAYNYASTGGERGEDQLRPLVWTIFSTPFVLFIGWVVARRVEVWLAAFACFCLYFFTPFVAARIELLVMSQEQATHSRHHLYFTLVIILHSIAALALTVWRAMKTKRGPTYEQPANEPHTHNA
jgi:cytochrome bd-type quinol oxidase subunit 2